MNNPRISIINPQAASDVKLSREVIGEAPLTPDILLAPWSHLLFNEKKWLSTSNFVSTQYLVYDFDEGVPTMQEATSQLASRGLKYIIGPSKSHQKIKFSGQQVKPACDRFRLVLFLDTPVTSIDHYKYMYVNEAQKLGFGSFDSQTIDVARFWNACTQIESACLDGKEIEVTPMPEKAIVKKIANTVRYTQGPTVQHKGKLNSRTILFINQCADDKPWHGEFVAAALDMKAQGYSEEEAAVELTKASPVNELDKQDLSQLADVYKNRTPFHSFKVNWPELKKDKGGEELPGVPHRDSTINFKYLVKELVEDGPYEYYINDATKRMYLDKNEEVEVDDNFVNSCYAAAAQHGLSKDKILIQNALTKVAHHYHPIKDFVSAAPWDGKDRIIDLFNTIKLDPEVSAEDAIFLREACFRRWIYAAIKRIYRPGTENGVLIFVGGQAAGKSRWFKNFTTAIWHKGFTEGLIDPDNKDHQAYLVDNFIHHIAELDATTSTKHAGKLKDYINRATVTLRRPYARVPITADTVCSFCATVNPSAFLQDATGSRRFFVIPIEVVNPDHDVDIQQICAQAYEEAVKGDYRTWLNKEEVERLNRRNDRFKFEDDFEGAINEKVSAGETPMTVKEICTALSLEYDFMNKTQKEKIITLLQMKRIPFVNHSGRAKYKVDEVKLRSNLISNNIYASKGLNGSQPAS